MTSFHSKIAQQLVKLELEQLAERDPVLGVHPVNNKNITWGMLVDSPSAPDRALRHALFPSDLPCHPALKTPTRRDPSAPSSDPSAPRPGISRPVAIVGAGVAGLRIAMMLKDLGIPYQIFEASKRYGGRIFTYHFKTQAGEKPSKQNYFDVGAMRFPDNAANARTFELFAELGITKEGGSTGKLLPYNISTDDNIMLFNDIKKTVGMVNKEPGQDHFNDGVNKNGLVPEEYIKKTYVKPDGTKLYGFDACVGAAYEPYKAVLVQDPKLGWELLMQHDSRSNRAHLLDLMRYPPSVVQWMETRDSGTGGYDSAFSEAIIDSLEFDYPTGYGPQNSQAKEIDWWCIDGGSEVLTKAMYKSLGQNPPLTTSSRVTSISKSTDKTYMELTVEAFAPLVPVKYSHVVSTVPLSCLRGIDLSGCELDYTQKTALRSLDYGTGIKVGIKFKTRWWQSTSFKVQGGSSKTDRQSRVVVYPNYGIEEPADTPGVLIATYNWNQDAFRFGSLIQTKDWSDRPAENAGSKSERSPSEDYLLNQIFNDLSKIHGQPPSWYRNEMVDHYAFDWYHNPYSMGGYAFFGPGKFSDLYPSVTKPAADGFLHFAGEAASCHHAWVAGALDSAWRCVWEILAKDGTVQQKEQFKEKYGGRKEHDDAETAVRQYYRGVFANTLEKPKGNLGKFPVHF